MKYTENQEKAINIRNREVLVSAAAGSGKTSVLVERILRRITDETNPVDIDKLLIMTFTSAAAKEMKDRIRLGIEKRIEEKPNDEDLRRQARLVQNAQITTIHGFCQNIIKEHYEVISLEPNFRVADENECKLIGADVLEKVLEGYYEQSTDEFIYTIESFATSKSDFKFAEYVQSLYRFSQSHPNPSEFLEECARPYTAASLDDFQNMSFIVEYLEMYRQRLKSDIVSCVKAVELINDTPALSKYYDTFDSDLRQMQKAYGEMSYDGFRECITSLKFEGLARILTKSIDQEAIEVQTQVKAIRDAYKNDISKVIKTAFEDSIEKAYINMSLCKTCVEVLIEIVKAYADEYACAKRDRNIIDFNDMEHMAISILEGNPAIAEEYRARFDEIYVDEYQDSNMTQEVLVSLIKRKESSGNLFMVGDVKQSIYRFRQARPDLFAGKYDSFTDEDSLNQRILLNDNFRSRREVINAVNEIFAAIMKKEFGRIEYDENARLKYGATYYPESNVDNKAEIIVGVGTDVPRTELEANIVAQRINQMISEGALVYDTNTQSMRPVEYRDIVVLLRSVKGWQETIKTVLEDSGIPVSVDSSEGYFDTTEVQTTMAFMSIVDNPLQDIPYATVMASPVFGFDNREMAIIRKDNKEGYLCESVERYLSREIDNETATEEKIIRNKCRYLVDRLRYYKDKSIYTPVHELIREFIDDDYSCYVRCMNRSEQRMANLNMLIIKAQDYAKTSFKGLFNFVRYIELIKKYEIESGEVSVLGDEDNVVRIMTIHKSKGLEFPICFVVGIDKKRNDADEKSEIVWDAKYGIGVDCVDPNKRTRCKTIYKNIIKQHLVMENVAEEMRVLYVAMTRAREKLVMVGYSKDEESLAKKKQGMIFCKSYWDMINLATNNNEEWDYLDLRTVTAEELVISKLGDEVTSELILNEIIRDINNVGYDEVENAKLKKKLEYKYPYDEAADIPVKLSVSELKHKAMEDNAVDIAPAGEELIKPDVEDRYIPEFMRSQGETTNGGSFYGTAFHRILELWPYDRENVTTEDIDVFAHEMLKGYRMSEEQVGAVRAADVVQFLNSSIGKRMYAAKQQGQLYREQPFTLGADACDVVDNLEKSDEIVLIQGIIDAFFVENGNIIIVDYKTDHVDDPETLVSRYKVQLEYYKKALTQLMERNVSELIIYSSRLNKIITL